MTLSGKLYVVGTPIGNLSDFSPRAVQTLADCDFIAAEDTRVSLKLLTHYGISKQLVSYHAHNLHQRGQQILARILAGENGAIITDAGMPCISDPGEDLVAMCAEAGVDVVCVPGPSAVISALAVSGLSTSRFSFEGFLSVRKSSRVERLEEIRNDPRTLIFYEAPHKLRATLEDMLQAFGPRRIALVRELTKIHEQVWRTTLDEAAAYYQENAPRGEFVLVLEGAPRPHRADEMSQEEAVLLTRALVAGGASLSDAAKEAARRTGFKKGDLYKAALQPTPDPDPNP